MKRQPGARFESAAWKINIHHVLIVKSILIQMNANTLITSCQRSSPSSFDPIGLPVFKRSKKSVFRLLQTIWQSRNFNQLKENRKYRNDIRPNQRSRTSLPPAKSGRSSKAPPSCACDSLSSTLFFLSKPSQYIISILPIQSTMIHHRSISWHVIDN